jgi:hypothetical protein
MAVQEDEGVRYVSAYPLPEGRKGTYRNLYRTVHSIMFSGLVCLKKIPPTCSQYGYGVTKSDLVDMILSELSILKICPDLVKI